MKVLLQMYWISLFKNILLSRINYIWGLFALLTMQVIITKLYKLVNMSLMQIIFSTRHYHSQLITTTKNSVSRKPAFSKP